MECLTIVGLIWIDLPNHTRNVYDLKWNIQAWNQRSYGNFKGVVDKPEKISI